MPDKQNNSHLFVTDSLKNSMKTSIVSFTPIFILLFQVTLCVPAGYTYVIYVTACI